MTSWRRLTRPIMYRFRSRRMREFQRLFAVAGDTRVLDVGGTPENWALLPVRPQLVMLNLTPPEGDVPAGVVYVVGDARALPFRDGAFDLCYSNSVIEHVGERADQGAMASEIARVGRRYYVQTPNRWFPVEPHLFTPFIHFLPRAVQRLMWRNFTVWGLVNRPTRETCERELGSIRLLAHRDVRRFFPDARILRERVWGLTKSFVAVRT